MRTPSSIGKHPLHPMLIVFPVGLWIFSLVCDLFYLGGGSPEVWSGMALYTMIGGFIGALMAAVPGFIDFLALKEARVRALAITHMSINLVLVVLYAVNIWLRVSDPASLGLPIVMSLLSVLMLGVSGWLGGEMVHVHQVGVEPAPPARLPEGVARDRRSYGQPYHA
jgi:uncharacterized membrane protein